MMDCPNKIILIAGLRDERRGRAGSHQRGHLPGWDGCEPGGRLRQHGQVQLNDGGCDEREGHDAGQPWKK